jgi:hypothetical protein
MLEPSRVPTGKGLGTAEEGQDSPDFTGGNFMAQRLESDRLAVESLDEAIELYFEKGWTDGLPVVPPTQRKIMEFLAYVDLEPDAVLGEVPERDRVIAAEKLAINAVMAGCKAEYMPILVAAVEAICDPDFKFNHLASLGSPWPLLVVNGPLGKELGFNSGMYVLGHAGHRANSTVARAISLLLWNCALARPDGIQRGQWGNPGRANYCIAENEDTAWEPLHSQLGFKTGSTTVTAISVYPGPYQVNCQRTDPELILESVSDAIATYDFYRGTYTLLVPPHFADIFSKQGWTKQQVRDHLFENTKRSVAELKRRGKWGMGSSQFQGFGAMKQEVEAGDEQRFGYVFKPHEYDEILFDDTALQRRSDIYVVVAGGNAGPRLCFLAPYGASTNPVTKEVRLPR